MKWLWRNCLDFSRARSHHNLFHITKFISVVIDWSFLYIRILPKLLKEWIKIYSERISPQNWLSRFYFSNPTCKNRDNVTTYWKILFCIVSNLDISKNFFKNCAEVSRDIENMAEISHVREESEPITRISNISISCCFILQTIVLHLYKFAKKVPTILLSLGLFPGEVVLLFTRRLH